MKSEKYLSGGARQCKWQATCPLPAKSWQVKALPPQGFSALPPYVYGSSKSVKRKR